MFKISCIAALFSGFISLSCFGFATADYEVNRRANWTEVTNLLGTDVAFLDTTALKGPQVISIVTLNQQIQLDKEYSFLKKQIEQFRKSKPQLEVQKLGQIASLKIPHQLVKYNFTYSGIRSEEIFVVVPNKTKVHYIHLKSDANSIQEGERALASLLNSFKIK